MYLCSMSIRSCNIGHKQAARALAELKQKDGSYDYTMEPRNILKDDKQKGWNCRKATPFEEWCDGFAWHLVDGLPDVA